MHNLKWGACLSIICVILSCLVVPVSAADYKVGVTAGQWIKYGNYEVVDAGDEGTIPAWSKLEVSAVAGQKILFFASGFYRNGTEFYYHMERTIEGNTTLIIAANLTMGDSINPSEEALINWTETRSYLGVYRTVNILELSSSVEGVEFSAIFVYDQVTGILLDYSTEETIETEQMSSEYKYSYNIIDTNIFGEDTSPTPKPTSDNELPVVWIAGAIMVIVIIVVTGIVFSIKKPKKKRRY